VEIETAAQHGLVPELKKRRAPCRSASAEADRRLAAVPPTAWPGAPDADLIVVCRLTSPHLSIW